MAANDKGFNAEELVLAELKRLNDVSVVLDVKLDSVIVQMTVVETCVKAQSKTKEVAESEQGFARCRVHAGEMTALTGSVRWMRRFMLAALCSVIGHIAWDVFLTGSKVIP
jgi:hypothetical protein